MTDIKRTFDILAAMTTGVVMAPVVASAAFAMAVANQSFPLYRQKRIGLHGKPFTIYKIKTMKDAKDHNGIPLPDNHRTTILGQYIRKSRIDELPQLFNILRGDMSMVGPRPVSSHIPRGHDEKRRSVRPGLTGLAQLHGCNGMSDDEILRLDHAYIDDQSILNDVMIIFLTPMSLIKNWGAPHYNKNAQLSVRPKV